MSYEIFDRRYSLIIGRPSNFIFQSVPSSIAKVRIPRYLAATKVIESSIGDTSGGIGIGDYRSVPENFLEIRDLSMKAKVLYKKTGSKGGNQYSTISLDNLTENTKNQIRVNDFIFLRAGYKLDRDSRDTPYEELPLILAAQITKVETKRSSDHTTMTTEIICGDNVLPRKSVKISKSWPPNTSRRQVLDDMLDVAKASYVPLGKVQEDIEGFSSPLKELYPYGYSVSGNLFEEIQKFCDSVDYTFYTVMGKMYVEPKGTAKKYETFILEEQTLKAPLQKYSDSSASKQGSKEGNTGILARTFLNGRILTNMAVDIRSGEEDWWGTYPIASITHDLDFEGNTWDTIVKTTVL
jgi:hypothetical protein